MTEEQVLHEVDEQLLQLTKKINLLKYLTPTNVAEERNRFVEAQGEYNPQFIYHPIDEDTLHGWIEQIEQLQKKYFKQQIYTHPMSKLLEEKIEETISKARLLLAYYKQDLADIEKYNTLLWGHFDGALVQESGTIIQTYHEPEVQTRGKKLSPQEVQHVVAEYIKEKGYTDLSINIVPHSLAKFMITFAGDHARLTFGETLSTRAHLLEANLRHEIDVHYQRYANGKQFGWHILAHGTAGYLKDEEGLAQYISCQTLQKYYPAFRKTSMYYKYYLLYHSQHYSFAQLTKLVRKANISQDDNQIFTLLLRVKRGIRDTSTIGAIGFCRDKVYLDGYTNIKKRLTEGNNLDDLLIAKIKREDIPYILR